MSIQNANLIGNINSSANLNLKGVIGGVGTPIGTRDYEKLINKPSINGKELIGNLDFGDLGDDGISTIEINEIVDEVFND